MRDTGRCAALHTGIMNTYLAIRWIHVLAATAWFGEVVTINFVLVPVLSRMDAGPQTKLLASIFPRLFRLASYLSATALLSGFTLLYLRFSSDWSALLSTGQGHAFLTGITLGTLLTGFHFLVEPRLDGMICVAADKEDFEMTDKIVRALKIIPRVGLAVITTIVIMMMVGSRGL